MSYANRATVAIAAHPEASYSEPPLMGRTPQDKAELAIWQWRADLEGLPAVTEAFRISSPVIANHALSGPKNCPQIP